VPTTKSISNPPISNFCRVYVLFDFLLSNSFVNKVDSRTFGTQINDSGRQETAKSNSKLRLSLITYMFLK
jgi:hypothetical protein